jgi:1-deoxy-D-xylulose-5-phosphate synthase
LNKYKILSYIDSPTDLRRLSVEELPLLCKEIRSLMIDKITKVGGHLGAGLGVVELTVALHYIFDTPIDKIIFDVGHQGYPHKIITGRKDLLHTIRQKGGISGFLKMNESKYDAFGAGHASTSISAALGMSYSNYILEKNNKNKFIAVIGDGSLTGGLAYEGLNNAGYLNKNLIVILNDNNISIDRNISAFSNYFNDLFSSQRIQNWKDTIWNTLGNAGSKGDRVRRLLSKAEGSFKSFITPGMLFEAIGFNYFGPINGNNMFKLVKMLNNIKKLNGPVFLHIITEKGKGYELAENDIHRLHSVGSINQVTGLSIDENADNVLKYQNVFGKAMLELFEKDKKLVAVTAAMLEGTGLTKLFEKYPDRVIDVGIAESHAVTFAAGMATQGIVPIVAIYSSFLQRAFDNIIHDCALQNLHIVFTLDRAGIVGEDGATHHGVFDFAYLRMIPNMVVMSPKDEQELRDMLYSAIYDYTYYCVSIRYPRGKGLNVAIDGFSSIPLGKGEILKKGKNICIIAIGKMVEVAINASEELEKVRISVGVVNARFVKPLDTELLDNIAVQYTNIITIEDGQKLGGFGSTVCEYFIEKGYKNNMKIMGIEDHFVEHGKSNLLLEEEGLCVDNLIKECKLMM